MSQIPDKVKIKKISLMLKSTAEEFFFKVDSAKQNALNQAIWNEPDILDQPTFITDRNDELNPNSILLEYNGKNWTINDFNKELRSHPFVFRKRKMNRGDFQPSSV